MSKRSRRRNRKVAPVGATSSVGKEEPFTAPGTHLADSEVLDNISQPDSVGDANRGVGDGATGDAGTDGVLEEVVRGVQEQRLGEWPFTIVMSDEDLLRFGEWVQVLGSEIEKTPVGLSVTENEIAFATIEQGWLLPRAAFSPAAKAVLRRCLFAERSTPAYSVRSIQRTTLKLQNWYDPLDINGLLRNIIHDMTALEYTTGRAVAHGLTALRDALDCASVAPMLALEAGNYYREVALPNRRHQYGYNIDHTGPSWTLKYDWLLFKVCAHYAKDPTITKWFQDGENPLTAFSAATGGLAVNARFAI